MTTTHKFLLTLLTTILLTACTPSFVAALRSATLGSANLGSATLAWDPNSEADLAYYTIYYGTDPSNLIKYVPNPNTDLGKTATPSAPSYTVSNLTVGVTYYFAVTATNTNNQESAKSNVVSKTL